MPTKRILPNDPRYKPQRRFLRQNATAAEEILWRYLRNRQISYKFRRQYSLFGFIADFYCHELILVIELDGWTHDFEKTRKRDYIKQNLFERKGYKVVRFTNEEVYGDADDLLQSVRSICQIRSQELNTLPSPPAPLPEGEG